MDMEVAGHNKSMMLSGRGWIEGAKFTDQTDWEKESRDIFPEVYIRRTRVRSVDREPKRKGDRQGRAGIPRRDRKKVQIVMHNK